METINPVHTAFLAGGEIHSLAVQANGTVWAWGGNANGQLGNGTMTDSATPIQVSNLSGITGSVTTTYTYDGSGLRMKKTVGGTTSIFAWDYSQGLPLLLTDGSTLYVYGLGGSPIEQVDSQGHVLYLHADQLGSTRVLTDSTGTVVGTYSYDAYGNTTAKTGTATTAFQFAGEYLDGETGTYYLRARYYDPGTGQFLSREPLAFLTRTPYGFVDGNPLNSIDPSGLARIAPADPRANCGGTYNQCVSTAGGLFAGYAVNASCLDTPMGVRITVAVVGYPADRCGWRQRFSPTLAAAVTTIPMNRT